MRTTGDPAGLTRTLRETVAGLDQLVPMSDVKTMTQRVDESIGTTRFSTFLASLFASVALVLGVPVGTVKTRLRHARRTLRALAAGPSTREGEEERP